MKTMHWLAVGVGVLYLLAGSAQAAEWHVATNGNDAADGTTWPTAKLTIQAGVDAASDGDVVWVSNGVYDTGGRSFYGEVTNRVTIDKPITVQSVNGYEVTSIQGSGPIFDAAVRCAYVGTNAVLTGFTLTNGYARPSIEVRYDDFGGGAWCEESGVLNNCFIVGNTASMQGGGVDQGTLNHCILTNNSSTYGGGASGGTLNDCILVDNHGGDKGGGAASGILNNCILSGNDAGQGGGAVWATLNNCLLTSNAATGNYYHGGGGADDSHLINCTVTANDGYDGGGVKNCTVDNCIVYDNTGTDGPNHIDSTFASSCTTPDPGGTNNITTDPQFVSLGSGNYRLGTNSPCINAGDNDLVQGDTDLDGHPRIAFGLPYGRVDMGAYEFLSTARYVAKSGSDAAAGTNWLTAKLTIQAAIDAADPYDIAIVSNGVYATGGRAVYGAMTNRVAIDKPMTVLSLTGSGATTIQGAWAPVMTNGDVAVRCAYVGTNALLVGFTLSQGATRTSGDALHERSGGGAWCESAGVLRNCLLSGNAADMAGGGAVGGTLYNCTVVSNIANQGGGSSGSSLKNSLVYGNTAATDANYSGGTFSYCCTTPDPGGIGNVTGDPQFVDTGAGDFQLSPVSPCIDAGDSEMVVSETDLAGNQRIVYGAVDIGAYEAQLTGPGTWFTAITNGLTNDTDCVAGDGVPNLLKYATGGSPRISDDLMLLRWVLNNGVPTLVLNRNPNATDVVLTVEGADVMSDDAVWRGLATNLNGSWGGAGNVSESGTGNPIEVTVEDILPLISNRFLRLKVTRP